MVKRQEEVLAARLERRLGRVAEAGVRAAQAKMARAGKEALSRALAQSAQERFFERLFFADGVLRRARMGESDVPL